MEYKIIPWHDFADFKQNIRLDGRMYTLRCQWNTVHEYWIMDIYDSNGVALLLGQKIVFNTDILARYRDSRLPDGKIYAIETGSEAQNISSIGRNDIGTNVLIIYEG